MTLDELYRFCLVRGVRCDEREHGHAVVYAGSSFDDFCKGLMAQHASEVTRGIEGHEYMRALGLILPVRVYQFGKVVVRVTGEAYRPSGLFSNLEILDRKVELPEGA